MYFGTALRALCPYRTGRRERWFVTHNAPGATSPRLDGKLNSRAPGGRCNRGDGKTEARGPRERERRGEAASSAGGETCGVLLAVFNYPEGHLSIIRGPPASPYQSPQDALLSIDRRKSVMERIAEPRSFRKRWGQAPRPPPRPSSPCLIVSAPHPAPQFSLFIPLFPSPSPGTYLHQPSEGGSPGLSCPLLPYL